MFKSYICPECGSEISFVGLEEGDLFSCWACGTDLIYTKGNLEDALIESEDWGE